MKNVWEVWPSALTADECDAIVKRADFYADEAATVGFAESSRSDTDYRSSHVRWFDPHREKDIVARLMQFVDASNRTNFGFDIVAPYEVQFTQYHGAQGGKYDWHQDVWL